MPRITPSEHHRRHRFLRLAWTNFDMLYSLLPVREQWQIHELYRPSEELTRDELAAHIKTLAVDKPALVHQVGKHVRLMERVFRSISQDLEVPRLEQRRLLNDAAQYYNPSPVTTDPKSGRRLRVRGVATTELDVAKFSKALLQLASDQLQPAMNTAAEIDHEAAPSDG